MFRSVVEAVFHYAENQPNKLCLADETRNVTYSQYKNEILKRATVLAKLSLSAGDRVVVEASQSIDYLATELAIQLIGAIFVPVERNCAWEKTLGVVRSSEAKIVIAPKERVVEEDFLFITFSELNTKTDAVECWDDYILPQSENISEILFSTGTTGKEKGIVLCHRNNIALAENVIFGVEMQEDNVEIIPSPLNHSHGLRRYYANMVKGATVVLVTSVMNVMGFFGMIDTYSVNSADLVPTALTVLLRLSKDKLADYKDTMRYIQFGSAPLSDSDKEKVCALLPNTHLYNFYGSTESGCISIYDFNSIDKANCIGKPTYNAVITIVDDDRKKIVSSEDNTGLLVSSGAMNMLCYWKDEEETNKVMKNGCIYSNDEAYFDEDGDIILLGRKGDVINVSGNKVSPDEIEEVASRHPIVEDCGCIGIKDPLRGNAPKLYVQIKEGYEYDGTSIRNWLSEHLEPYKVPVSIEEIDKIPRSFNGKLLRRTLRNKHEE
ncbi:MAG: acyl--CoA ligase [Agathobacter sp.]|nr:acyl--CoA ligase [Agathobacter sp.]